jgi:WD40 repeat protein
MGLVWAPHSGNLAVFMFKPQGNLWKLWDATAGKPTRTFPLGGGDGTILAWSPDAKSLAAGNVLYDVATGRQIATYPPAGTLVAQAWSPDGKRLAVSWYAATLPGLYTPRYSVLSLINTATGTVIAQYDQGENSAILGDRTLAWSPDGRELLVVRDGAEIWRMG